MNESTTTKSIMRSSKYDNIDNESNTTKSIAKSSQYDRDSTQPPIRVCSKDQMDFADRVIIQDEKSLILQQSKSGIYD